VDRLQVLYQASDSNKRYFDEHNIHDLLGIWDEISAMCRERELTSTKMFETLRQLALVALATIQGQPNNTIGIIELLDQMKTTHDKKNKDYGTQNEPFANVLASQELGVDPILAVCIRMNDKVTRLKSFLDKGNLENESVEDSLLDIAVYSIINVVIIDESWNGKSSA